MNLSPLLELIQPVLLLINCLIDSWFKFPMKTSDTNITKISPVTPLLKALKMLYKIPSSILINGLFLSVSV